MSKIGTTNQLIKQTFEHERNLELQRRQGFQRIFQELEFLTQNSGTIIKNQQAQEASLKSHSDLLIQARQEISELIKEQLAMRRSQKRL